MVNRRHIRVKVMQSIYAMHQNGSDNLEKQEKSVIDAAELTILHMHALPPVVSYKNLTSMKSVFGSKTESGEYTFENLFSFLGDQPWPKLLRDIIVRGPKK